MFYGLVRHETNDVTAEMFARISSQAKYYQLVGIEKACMFCFSNLKLWSVSTS